MKDVNCNYCGRDETELVNEGPDFLLNKGNFRLVRCRHCGLIYQNPQPTRAELALHYPDEYPRYIKQGEDSRLQQLSQSHALSRQRHRLENHYPGPGRLLDVGCATGLFLAHMQQAGWQVAGVEPSLHAAQYAREAFDLDVQTGTLADTAYPDAHFDVITLWDVLEHVTDPKETLAEITRILKPNGLLVTSLPNPTSVEARLFGRYWLGWERPRHLHLFTPDLLRHYLADAGLTMQSVESFSGRLSVTLISIGYWLTGRGIPEARWQPWLKAAYNWPLRLATWPLYRLGEALNKTTTMTVFAIKKDSQKS